VFAEKTFAVGSFEVKSSGPYQKELNFLL